MVVFFGVMIADCEIELGLFGMICSALFDANLLIEAIEKDGDGVDVRSIFGIFDGGNFGSIVAIDDIADGFDFVDVVDACGVVSGF